MTISHFPPDEILPRSWTEAGGKVYGAVPDDAGPIGGGAGYARVVTGGDYFVRTAAELIEALKKVKAGEVVFVDSSAEIDLTDRILVDGLVLKVPEGATLASGRGADGAPGALLYSDEFRTNPLIEIVGPGARITGLRLRGPDPKRRIEFHRRVYYEGGGGAEAYYRFPKSVGIATDHPRLEVDNCEISGWSLAGISPHAGVEHHFHHNYIHHCQQMGLGYGVCLDRTPNALIEYNRFRDNKHHIAGTGRPGSGYTARHNVVFSVDAAAGPQSQLFDMHGGEDRQDGTNIAGARIIICNNTFVSPNLAVCIRGIPEEGAEVSGNWRTHGGSVNATEVARDSSGSSRWIYSPDAERALIAHQGGVQVHDNACGVPPEVV